MAAVGPVMLACITVFTSGCATLEGALTGPLPAGMLEVRVTSVAGVAIADVAVWADCQVLDEREDGPFVITDDRGAARLLVEPTPRCHVEADPTRGQWTGRGADVAIPGDRGATLRIALPAR